MAPFLLLLAAETGAAFRKYGIGFFCNKNCVLLYHKTLKLQYKISLFKKNRIW